MSNKNPFTSTGKIHEAMTADEYNEVRDAEKARLAEIDKAQVSERERALEWHKAQRVG